MPDQSGTTIGLIVGLATLFLLVLVQAVAIAYWGGGLAARVRTLESAAPVAADLTGILAGLVATVGGLKTAMEKSDTTSAARFHDIERKLDDLGKQPRARRAA